MFTIRSKTVGVILLVLFLAGCAGSAAPQGHQHKMAALDQMPDYVQSAPVRVQEAYQFAVANPEIVSQSAVVVAR
jgi:hypothetical protein